MSFLQLLKKVLQHTHLNGSNFYRKIVNQVLVIIILWSMGNVKTVPLLCSAKVGIFLITFDTTVFALSATHSCWFDIWRFDVIVWWDSIPDVRIRALWLSSDNLFLIKQHPSVKFKCSGWKHEEVVGNVNLTLLYSCKTLHFICFPNRTSQTALILKTGNSVLGFTYHDPVRSNPENSRKIVRERHVLKLHFQRYAPSRKLSARDFHSREVSYDMTCGNFFQDSCVPGSLELGVNTKLYQIYQTVKN